MPISASKGRKRNSHPPSTHTTPIPTITISSTDHLRALIKSNRALFTAAISSLTNRQQQRGSFIKSIRPLSSQLRHLPAAPHDFTTAFNEDQLLSQLQYTTAEYRLLLSKTMDAAELPEIIAGYEAELQREPVHEVWAVRSEPRFWSVEEMEESMETEAQWHAALRENRLHRNMAWKLRRANFEAMKGLTTPFIRPLNLRTGREFIYAPNSYDAIAGTTKEEWKEVFEFYSMPYDEKAPLDEMAEGWCVMLNVAEPLAKEETFNPVEFRQRVQAEKAGVKDKKSALTKKNKTGLVEPAGSRSLSRGIMDVISGRYDNDKEPKSTDTGKVQSKKMAAPVKLKKMPALVESTGCCSHSENTMYGGSEGCVTKKKPKSTEVGKVPASKKKNTLGSERRWSPSSA